MKETSSENFEKRRIAKLARRYKAEGYQVLADLPGYETPYQIQGFRPDLIVKKDDKIIVIEVKTSHSIKSSKEVITQFARYAKEVPQARFKLVITNPRMPYSVYSKVETLQAELGILRDGLLADIKNALERKRTDLVLLLAVRLLESLLARLAMRESIYIPPKEWNLASLSSRLANENVISKPVLEFAHKLHQQRNVLIHEKRYEISIEEASEIYQKLNKLAKQWGEKIKMVEVICPVCDKSFNSYLNLARHMVLKDRPEGKHIQWLEQFLGKPFVEFGWKSDKKIAIALKKYFEG